MQNLKELLKKDNIEDLNITNVLEKKLSFQLARKIDQQYMSAIFKGSEES